MKQRGIAIGWVYLIALVAIVGAVWYGCSVLIQHGRKLEAGDWQKRENVQLIEAQAKFRELNDKYRAIERSQARHDVVIATQYEKDVKRGSEKKSRTLDAVRAGTVSLRVPVTACNEAARGVVSVAGAGAGERDGAASGELSRPAAEFLIGLASEADAIVVQLASCQAILQSDRGGS